MLIKNPNNLPLIDYRTLKPLQGDLKDLTEKNYQKLKHVLEKRGFEIPFFVWHDGTDYYILDGHQRQRVMMTEDMHDDGSYEVPYVEIKADNRQEAMAKLLEISSQYGTITQEGFDWFIMTAELPEAEVIESVNFDALRLEIVDTEKQEEFSEGEKYIVSIRFDSQSDLEDCLERINEVVKPYSANVSVNNG